MRYLVRGGIAWAQLPREFPPRQTVYGIFGRWAKAGAWQRVHDALREVTIAMITTMSRRLTRTGDW
jgi:transposase